MLMKCSTSNIATILYVIRAHFVVLPSSRIVSYPFVASSSRLVSFRCIIVCHVASPFPSSTSRIVSSCILSLHHCLSCPHLASSRILSLRYYSSCRTTISFVHISHRLASSYHRLYHVVSYHVVSYRRTFVCTAVDDKCHERRIHCIQQRSQRQCRNNKTVTTCSLTLTLSYDSNDANASQCSLCLK